MNDCITIKWTVSDVQSVRPDLTDEQAYEVLLYVEDNHDANNGITWNTLSWAAETLYGEQEEE
jgi:hypothetical protein